MTQIKGRYMRKQHEDFKKLMEMKLLLTKTLLTPPSGILKKTKKNRKK